MTAAGDAPAKGRSEEEEHWRRAREEMLVVLERHGIRDPRVLAAMGRVRRHVFIPEGFRSPDTAYGDHPTQIGHGQTISQPFIVAYMIDRLQLPAGARVLEVGAGSGYLAAVLAEMGMTVWAVERIAELAAHAREVLRSQGYGGVRVRCGDGYLGWPEHAPYHGCIVSCAPASVPDALVAQLADNGRLILPVGEGLQRLVLVTREGGVVRRSEDIAVRFVPMLPSG